MMQARPAAQSSQEGSTAPFALRQGHKEQKEHSRIGVLGRRKSREGVAMAGTGPVPGHHPAGWGHGPAVRSCSRVQGEELWAGIGCVHRSVLPCPARQGLCTLTSTPGRVFPKSSAHCGQWHDSPCGRARRGSGCTRGLPRHQHNPEHVRAKQLQTPLQEPRAASTAIKSRGRSAPTSWHSGNLPGSRYIHVSLAHLCTVEKHCKGSQIIRTAEVEK